MTFGHPDRAFVAEAARDLCDQHRDRHRRELLEIDVDGHAAPRWRRRFRYPAPARHRSSVRPRSPCGGWPQCHELGVQAAPLRVGVDLPQRPKWFVGRDRLGASGPATPRTPIAAPPRTGRPWWGSSSTPARSGLRRVRPLGARSPQRSPLVAHDLSGRLHQAFARAGVRVLVFGVAAMPVILPGELVNWLDAEGDAALTVDTPHRRV